MISSVCVGSNSDFDLNILPQSAAAGRERAPKMSRSLRILSDADVRAVLSWPDAIAASRRAFLAQADVPLRHRVRPPHLGASSARPRAKADSLPPLSSPGLQQVTVAAIPRGSW